MLAYWSHYKVKADNSKLWRKQWRQHGLPFKGCIFLRPSGAQVDNSGYRLSWDHNSKFSQQVQRKCTDETGEGGREHAITTCKLQQLVQLVN